MSLDAYVFFNEGVSTIAEWQRGLDALGFPLVLLAEGSLTLLCGHLPARWKEREAGFECSFGDVDELVKLYDDVDFGGPWRHVMTLHYATFSGGIGAILAAAGLAHVTGGIVYDPQEGAVFHAVSAADHAREQAIALLDVEARFERGDFRTG